MGCVFKYFFTYPGYYTVVSLPHSVFFGCIRHEKEVQNSVFSLIYLSSGIEKSHQFVIFINGKTIILRYGHEQ